MWSERANRDSWAISSVVEHFVDIEGVTSSNLVSPTMNPALAQRKIRHDPVTADINITFTAITCTSLRETLLLRSGDPGRIRTCNLPLRRGLLYPVEPRGRVSFLSRRIFFVMTFAPSINRLLNNRFGLS